MKILGTAQIITKRIQRGNLYFFEGSMVIEHVFPSDEKKWSKQVSVTHASMMPMQRRKDCTQGKLEVRNNLRLGLKARV